MPRDVFISHAGDDATVAVEVCALLEARGLKCWMAPRDVAAGSVWDEAILDAIETSRVFLLILSKSANDSQFVKNEVNRAFSQRKPIVTFRLEDVTPGRSLELYLARHHWTDAFPPPMGARVERLAGSITALLDSPTTPAATPAVAVPVRPTLGSRLLSPLSAVAQSVRAISRQTLIYSMCTLMIGAAIAGFVAWNLKPLPTKPVIRTVINLPPGQQLAGLENGPAIALSPDGTHLTYVATQGGIQQLYLRAMDSLESRPIPGTEGASAPFSSPDGQWVGFFADGKMKKVSISGGDALPLGDAPFPRGASWSSQGTITSGSAAGVLQEVPDAGGTLQPLMRLEKGEFTHRWPEFLPGGKAVLFATGSTGTNWINAQIAVQSVGTGEQRNLIQGGTQPRYAPSGHLVYAQRGNLMAVPFDPQRLIATGAAVPVEEGVLQSPFGGAAQYSFSGTGTLVYVPGGILLAQLRLAWVNRNGAEQPVAVSARGFEIPRVSPDGRQVAVNIQEHELQIWLYDLSRETLSLLTFGGNTNGNATWTPDGKRIAFTSNKEGQRNLFWQMANGSGGQERLTTSEYLHLPGGWSPDGQLLAFTEVNPTTGVDIWVLRMSDRKAQPFLRTKYNEGAPRFSPDGRWLAYISDESGHFEIYVQPYPGPGGKWQISTEGGTEPVWNPNGRELFYRNGDKMMAVDIATQPSFAVGKPRMLFQGPYAPSPGMTPNYDVTSDGQSFLMLKSTESAQAAPTQINVVLNWFEELKQKVPTGKN